MLPEWVRSDGVDVAVGRESSWLAKLAVGVMTGLLKVASGVGSGETLSATSVASSSDEAEAAEVGGGSVSDAFSASISSVVDGMHDRWLCFLGEPQFLRPAKTIRQPSTLWGIRIVLSSSRITQRSANPKYSPGIWLPSLPELSLGGL